MHPWRHAPAGEGRQPVRCRRKHRGLHHQRARRRVESLQVDRRGFDGDGKAGVQMLNSGAALLPW